MAPKNQKKSRISKYKKSEDTSGLHELQEPEGIYYTNDAQKKAIAEALEQVKNGQTFTNEEVDKEIDEWLNE